MQSILNETVSLPALKRRVKVKRAVIQWVSNIYTCCCRTQWEAAQCESQTTVADRPNNSSTCTNHPADFSWLHLRSTDCLWKTSALEAGCGFPYWPRGTVFHQHWAPWILSMRGHSHGIMWALGIFHWLINPCGAAGPGWDEPPLPPSRWNASIGCRAVLLPVGHGQWRLLQAAKRSWEEAGWKLQHGGRGAVKSHRWCIRWEVERKEESIPLSGHSSFNKYTWAVF